MSDSPVIVYRPAEAARVAQCDRTRIDAACYEGALTAQDLTPDSQKGRGGSGLLIWMTGSSAATPPARRWRDGRRARP